MSGPVLALAALAAAATAIGMAAPRADRARAGFPDTPPPARTGGFGEPTCRACHFDGELNAAGGSLSVSGAPARYEPGRTYRLAIELRREAMRTGGFELAARFATGAAAGKQAGTLRSVDDRAQVKTAASGVQYASHTRPGIQLTGAGSIAWALEWTAPDAAAGDVAFHAAANSANDDRSPLGDLVYTTAATSRPR